MATQPNQFSLDGPQDAFRSFYDALPEVPNTTVRVFDRGEYFTVHGRDAFFAAKEVFKTTAVIKYHGTAPQHLEYCTLSKSNYESFMRELLLVLHYRVEVYFNRGTANKPDWILQIKASPGNLVEFEELLFGNHDMCNNIGVMAVKLTTEGVNRVVSVGYVNCTEYKMGVAEFTDDDSLMNLQALVVHLGPKECLLCAKEQNTDYVKVKQVMERNNILVTERKKSDFSSKDMTQDLGRLLKFKKGESENVSSLPQLELTKAMDALSATIKYLELLSNENNFSQFRLSSIDLSSYVRMDSAALQALNVLPAPHETNKQQSVYGLLNKCRTPQGQRLLNQWIKQPLLDKNMIEERLSIVELFVTNTELRQKLREDHLRRLPDFQRIGRKFQRKRGTLQDCFKIHQALCKLPDIIEVLEQTSPHYLPIIRSYFIHPLHELVQDFSKFCEMVETTMDVEHVEEGEYFIRPTFDEQLSEIREQMENLEDEICEVLKDVQQELACPVKLESNTQLGYYFRVTKKEEKILRTNRNYKMIDATKSGVRFNNSVLRKLNEDWMLAKHNYEEQQKAVVDEIINIAAGYCDPLQNLSEVVAKMDVLLSLATVAASSPGCYIRPVIREMGAGVLSLKQVRHPCLEVQEGCSYIPNDVLFEKDKQMFHIITGPNMGGKSTFIRSIGVVVLMAQIGSYVPADYADISIVDSILARVGASDCQVKGVSTFMAEMLETATIIKSASENSLIIIDELGRGTSTYDGFGLAWAISEHIAVDIGAFCLFATHFHELTALADVHTTVQNLHVTALTSGGDLTFLYQVNPGVCDQSFGIHVAELAHFPKDVIEFAKIKAAELEDYHSGVLTGVDNTDEPAVKQRRLEKEEGERIVKEFILEAKALAHKQLSQEEIYKELCILKEGVKAKNNFYIQDLLTKCTK